MSPPFLTVDGAARLLQLHPKTVLRFIREGRLRATKVGKQYRVLQSDIAALAGGAPAAAQRARVTSIVDIAPADLALQQRLSTLLLASINGGTAADAPISLDIAHDPQLGSLKLILVASPADTAGLLRLVEACLEDRADPNPAGGGA